MGHYPIEEEESLRFYPPLDSSISVFVPPVLTFGSRLRWRVNISQEYYKRLCEEGTHVQVWSDIAGTDEWSEITFERIQVNVPNEAKEHVDISLLTPEPVPAEVLLEATVPLPSMLGRTVKYTYRLKHHSKSITWKGTENTNGTIAIHETKFNGLSKENDNNDSISWRLNSTDKPTVIINLNNDVRCRGCFFREEGPTTFTNVLSDATEMVALAVLPGATSDACVVYSPILLIAGSGSLSTTYGGEVLFDPGDGESLLYAYDSLSTWKDYIPDNLKTNFLDVKTTDFMGIFENGGSISRVSFLPVTGSPAVATLIMSKLISLAPTAAFIVSLNPISHACEPIPVYSQRQGLRIAVGPFGGEISIVSGHALSATMSVACLLHDSENVVSAELDSNPHALADSRDSNLRLKSNHHSLTIADMFSLAVYLLQYFLGLLFWVTLTSDLGEKRKPTTHQESPTSASESPISSRLTFNVTGQYTILVQGDISELVILLDGKKLQIASKDIGRGHWLIESAETMRTDHAQLQFELSPHE